MLDKIVEAPWCYNAKDYMDGVNCCYENKALNTETASEDFIAGYGDQYALEQCNEHRSICHA